MTPSRDGQVVTFYSYKGGTGRTMALANVAWILAANGKRVLVADWDLESPGLHRFFKPFIEPAAFASTGGVIDLIREFEQAAQRRPKREERWYEKFARVEGYAFSLNWDFPGKGTLDFLSAGRQNNEYAANLAALDWDIFYQGLGGGPFLDALRDELKRQYDYTLIDSRTGVSDVASVCTVHLPDVLVACFTLSDQGIDGAARVAREVRDKYRSRRIRILPVPMRLDPAEKQKLGVGLAMARQEFAGLPTNMLDTDRAAYWATMQVPYQAYYAYEEILATFGDAPGAAMTLLSTYETLARHITQGEVSKLPPMAEALRERVIERFLRQPAKAVQEITLRYAPEDQLWADWIDELLSAAGVTVLDAPSARPLVIISAAEPKVLARQPADDDRLPLAVYVTNRRALPEFPQARSAFVAGAKANVSAERILRLVGHSGTDVAVSDLAPRYPGSGPAVFNVPPRNTRFTGREDDLRQLRDLLKARGSGIVVPGSMPVALHGMGGIGKTQVAIEYAHRFGAAYDVVWWIDADPVTFVDVKLGDLGVALGIPAQQSVTETTRNVLRALGSGGPHARWLVIFDNADDVDAIGPFLPSGPGHVLITSRNASWSDRAQAIAVEVFKRHESIAHLRERLPKITDEEANQIADRLGDLPIAVAAAAALLRETGTAIDDYLRELEIAGPGASVDATWDLSLAQLRNQSPAAYRMLQLCSVMAPEISRDLVYSDELAKALEPLDPALKERLNRSRLVQLINRLSLLRVDLHATPGPMGERGLGAQAASIHVHRLLQQVLRSRMTKEELAAVRHQVHLVLAASRPAGETEVDDPGTWPSFRRLWPHLEISEAMECTDEAVRGLLIERVRYIWITGGLAQGRELAERIDQVWTEQYDTMDAGDGRRRTLRVQILHLRFNLANVLRDQAEFQAARALDEATLKEQRELLGFDHPHTLMTAGGLAGDLRAFGRYEDARRQDERTYATWAQLNGEDHHRTLTALSNLAASYRLAGDYRAALERDQAVYQRRRVIHGDSHPNTLLSASSLGRDLREAGDYQESVRLLTEVRDTAIQVFGPDSRRAHNASANLAVSLRSAGQALDAAELLNDAYQRLDNIYGATSPDTLAARLSRAVNLLAVAENARAAEELELAVAENARAGEELESVRRAYHDTLGPTHPHTLVCLSNLAAVARAMNEPARARAFAQSATDGLRKVLGPDHPYTLAAQTNLIVCMAEDGDLAPALGLADEVSPRLADMLGEDHPDAVRCQANQALIMRTLGGTEAQGVDQLVDRLAARIGADHPTTEALKQGRYLHRIIDPHPF